MIEALKDMPQGAIRFIVYAQICAAAAGRYVAGHGPADTHRDRLALMSLKERANGGPGIPSLTISRVGGSQ